jgi:hypothetical protein
MENLEEKNVPTSPEKWAQAKAQAKAKFDVYPSAYANGWAAKKYKEMGGGWKSVSEEVELEESKDMKAMRIIKDIYKRKSVKEEVKDKFDIGEYDQEGDMAKSDLRSIMANAKRVHDMLEDSSNLPEWVQSKITLAEDYISTVANYMTSEMSEEVQQIDELTGKGQLPKIAAYHKQKGDEAKGKMETIRNTNRQVPVPKEKSAKIYAKDAESTYHYTQAKRAKALMAKEEVEQVEESFTMGEKVPNKQGGHNQDVHYNGKKIGRIESYSHRTGMKYGMEHHASGEGTAGSRSHEEALSDLKSAHKEHMKEEVEQVEEGQMKRMATDAEETKRLGSWRKETPWMKVKSTVTDKSGAKHTPMSRARDLARSAAKKNVKESVSITESRLADIVREAAEKAKKKKKEETKKSDDTFQAEPELSSQIIRND